MYEFEAASIIDYYTFNRLKKGEGYSSQSNSVKEAVSRCEFKIISLLQLRDSATVVSGDDASNESVSVAGISSQSNDGVSISYNVLSASEASVKAEAEVGNAIKMYLSTCKNSLGQKLLYRGIYPDE